MSFLTELCQDHHHLVVTEIVRCLSLQKEALVSPPPVPSSYAQGHAVQVAGFWLTVGGNVPFTDESYILTQRVRKNLHNLARAVSAR